eukprot:COSAG01_NODE_2859_length_6958_cov_21.603994_4_plen_100_part_00
MRSSVALWRLFLDWVLAAVGNGSSDHTAAAEAAKRVFFRAIRACPSAKQLWLTAFARPELSGTLRKAELEGLHTMLLEKEIRTVAVLEEVEMPLFALPE